MDAYNIPVQTPGTIALQCPWDSLDGARVHGKASSGRTGHWDAISCYHSA
jgi:hypothetical protein